MFLKQRKKDFVNNGAIFDNDPLLSLFAACFKLTSCDRGSSTQNIHAYGAMLIVSSPITVDS